MNHDRHATVLFIAGLLVALPISQSLGLTLELKSFPTIIALGVATSTLFIGLYGLAYGGKQ